MTPQEFQSLLKGEEGRHLEFKAAQNRYDFEELVRYCVALANEGGGQMILGVSDQKPRRVVGTSAFRPPQRTEQGLTDRLRLKIQAEELIDPAGRVLIFHVPSRPLGIPIAYCGAYWMRSGEGLVPMTPDMLKRIFAESGPDYSAEVCPQAKPVDLLPAAVEDFRRRWQRKSANPKLSSLTYEQLLADAELTVDGQLTYAALILFGSRQALGRHLAQAEVIFEYRSSEAPVAYQRRLEFRQGFFSFADELWTTINLRNDRQSYQDGLFRYDLPTFSEGVVREAILNAVGHRDYRHGGSIFVKQFPRYLEITNPGGFPTGITPENILDHQNPRNRRLAETFARCGLIERSGQGMNRIYEETIRQSKPLPDFSGSDEYQVRLILRGEVQNPAFIRYLEQVGQERLSNFTTHDFVVLDHLQRQLPVPPLLRPRLAGLLRVGVIEKAGRNRFILSRSLYAHIGQKGAYTRVRGLSDAENSTLLLKHITDNAAKGSPLTELLQVVPSLAPRHVQYLLKRLKDEGKITAVGGRRWAGWFAVKNTNPKLVA